MQWVYLQWLILPDKYVVLAVCISILLSTMLLSKLVLIPLWSFCLPGHGNRTEEIIWNSFIDSWRDVLSSWKASGKYFFLDDSWHWVFFWRFKHIFHACCREEEMQELNRTTNSRMGWLSFLSLFVCLSVAGLQLWHLKTFFEKKKLI